ncbi:MAG: DISARM system phospholipase D-like protein DrmC [Chthonomonadales bacterium]
MKKNDEILHLLDQMPASLLETLAEVDLAELDRSNTKYLTQMAVTTASGSDRIMLGRLVSLVGGDDRALAYSVGAAAAMCLSRHNHSSVQMVLSGPELDASKARDTAAVVSQLISGAKAECLLMTYVFSHADIPLNLLTSAARSGVSITCVFDLSPLNSNDISTLEPLKELLDLNARVLCWNHPHGVQAAMHAKGIVADRERCLITSANLTSKALTQNVELGVLLTDPVLGVEIIQHIEHLRERGWITPFVSLRLKGN